MCVYVHIRKHTFAVVDTIIANTAVIKESTLQRRVFIGTPNYAINRKPRNAGCPAIVCRYANCVPPPLLPPPPPGRGKYRVRFLAHTRLLAESERNAGEKHVITHLCVVDRLENVFISRRKRQCASQSSKSETMWQMRQKWDICSGKTSGAADRKLIEVDEPLALFRLSSRRKGRFPQALPGVMFGCCHRTFRFITPVVLGYPRSRCHENGRIFSPREHARSRARKCKVEVRKWKRGVDDTEVTIPASLGETPKSSLAINLDHKPTDSRSLLQRFSDFLHIPQNNRGTIDHPLAQVKFVCFRKKKENRR